MTALELIGSVGGGEVGLAGDAGEEQRVGEGLGVDVGEVGIASGGEEVVADITGEVAQGAVLAGDDGGDLDAEKAAERGEELG